MEGSRPDEHRIRSQARIGISRVDFAMETDWGNESTQKQTLEQHQDQLRKAQKASLDQLQEVWLGLEQWLFDSLPSRAALLTMLSHAQGHPIQGHRIQDSAKARTECNALLQNAKAAARQLIATGDHCLASWVPQAPDNVARLA